MKKWALWLLAWWLIPVCGLAAIDLSLSAPSLAVESILDFQVQASGAQEYRYTLYQGEKELFTTQSIPYDFGSYLPRKEGQYTLKAEALLAGQWESAQADFTVTAALSCALSPLPPTIQAGDGLWLQALAQGGDGRYRYYYEIFGPAADESAPLLSQEGEDTLLFVPQQAGQYRLLLRIADGMGAFADYEEIIQVQPGPGISWEADGGALLSSGGQKSYIIYADGPWTASSESPFLRVLQGEGLPGDRLILEIADSVHSYRAGKILLECEGKQAVMTVGQSAQSGLDEDYSYLLPADPVLVEGQIHALWLSAEGMRDFSILSASPWKANSDDSFIQWKQTENGLSLSLSPWQGAGVRKGMVTIANASSQAAIHIYQAGSGAGAPRPFEAASPFPVPPEEENFILYSQCSGYWKDKKYRTSTLEHSGCAVFSLAHALQHLGYSGNDIRPEILAQTYAFALVSGGTMNDLLVGHAGDDFGFKTRYELYKDLPTIRSRMDQGAVYSFGVVTGHIAMIIEKNDSGNMFRVVDSAPSATWERIKNASLYLQQPDGSFRAIQSLTEIPGIRYYIETESFGGATYWLEDQYIVKRGVRLIQPR